MGMAAMLGTGRNQLSRGLLRQGAKVRDVRTLASVSLSREAARQATSRAKPAFGLETGSIYRSIYTTRVLGDEVKIIVCPAFADSIPFLQPLHLLHQNQLLPWQAVLLQLPSHQGQWQEQLLLSGSLLLILQRKLLAPGLSTGSR